MYSGDTATIVSMKKNVAIWNINSFGEFYIPDLYSRYFTADFSYGLTIIKQIVDFAEVATPNIDATMGWYVKLALEQDSFKYSDYSILTRRDFEKFYLR